MPLLTRSTWIKITLIALLCLVLCGGMISCSSAVDIAGRHADDISDRIQHSMNFSEHGDFTIPAQDVESLKLIWLAGEVDIQVVDDKTATDSEGNLQITGTETFMGPARSSFPMTWQVEDGMLEVSYSASSGLTSCSNIGEKQLVLTLPQSVAQSLKVVDLAGASGMYHLGAISCKRLNIDLASGRIEGNDVNAQTLALDVASGNVQLSGNFTQEIDLDLASGNIDLTCPNACPGKTSFDLASGQVSLAIPANSGVTAHIERLSGSFNCNLGNGQNQANEGTMVFGDGTNTLNVRLASGTINVSAL